jgi:hypothetical protein
MSDLSLQDIRDFNSCLRTIHAAGVPLYFDLPSKSGVAIVTIDCATHKSLAASLFAVEAAIANAVSSGMPPTLALQQNSLVPSNYRQSLLLWHRTERLPLAFEPITVAAQVQRRAWGRLAVSLVQPLIAIMLAYCCLAFICAFVTPLFEALSRQTHASPGPFLTALQWLRTWMPVWLLAIPVGIFLFAFKPLFRRKHTPSHRRLANSNGTWVTQAEFASRAHVAAFADHLNSNGLPNSETTAWVQSTVGSQLQVSDPPNASDKSPTLLAWAVNAPTTDTTSSPTGSRLRVAAAIYAASAETLASRGRNFIQPRIRFILFGGFLVLAVSVLVFGPLIELLLFISVTDRSLIQ